MLESSGGNNESEEVKELKVIYNLSEDYITTLGKMAHVVFRFCNLKV